MLMTLDEKEQDLYVGLMKKIASGAKENLQTVRNNKK